MDIPSDAPVGRPIFPSPLVGEGKVENPAIGGREGKWISRPTLLSDDYFSPSPLFSPVKGEEA